MTRVRTGFFRTMIDAIKAGTPVGWVTVIENTNHSPGTVGARMWVGPNGPPAGTIGGGIMEAQVIEELRARLNDPPAPSIETFVHRKKARHGRTSGLICAGSQTHLNVFPTQDDLAPLQKALTRLEQDEDGILSVSSDGAIAFEEHDGNLAPGISVNLEQDPFQIRERLIAPLRAAIFGGGHCGVALCDTLTRLGYSVTVFEERDEVFTFQRISSAARKIVVDSFAQGAALIQHPEITWVVVMTAGLPGDVRALKGIANHRFPYVGVMGSKAKIHQIRKELTEAGVPEDVFETWIAPVGLPMVSNTPEEIAISIAAQFLQLRKRAQKP